MRHSDGGHATAVSNVNLQAARVRQFQPFRKPLKGSTRMPAHRRLCGDAVSAFFAALERGEPVSRACRAAGCSRQALYRRRVKDLAFDQRWREAETALRAKKTKEQSRSRKGVTFPVFCPRGRAGHKKTLSDGMLLARLKALRPAYRD